MGDRHREAEQRLALERRLDDEDVRCVARTVEGVVDDVDVPRARSCRRSARTASSSRSGSIPSCSGIVTACATVSPLGPQSAAEKSIASRTTPSARCGRSSSPSRRRRSRARLRRAARATGLGRCRIASTGDGDVVEDERSRRSDRRATLQPGGTTTVVSYSSTSDRACDRLAPSEERLRTVGLERPVVRHRSRPAASRPPVAAGSEACG